MSPRNPDKATNRADARDRGLRRVRFSTGLITTASAAGVVVLAGGYAHAMPGQSGTAPSTAKHTQTASHQPTSTTARKPATSAQPQQTQQTKQSTQAKAPTASSTPTLQAPTQAPQSTSNNATSQATSGGS